MKGEKVVEGSEMFLPLEERDWEKQASITISLTEQLTQEKEAGHGNHCEKRENLFI